MHPIHDVDVILLLALALAAKRRPAELVEIVSAIETLQGAIPAEVKLADALARLGNHGLVGEVAGCFTLTPAAQAMLVGLSKKAVMAERIIVVKEQLADYLPAGEFAPITITQEQFGAAILAHRAVAKTGGTGENLLLPKSAGTERNYQRPRQWRRGPTAGGQKTARSSGRKS
jgi:hypothetical protein